MTDDGVCVVTHPLAAAGENATRSLLDILTALGPVSLVTANLPADSEVWENPAVGVIQLTEKGAGESVPVAAFRFLRNQARMCRTLAGREEDTVLFFGATSYLLPIAFARLLGKRVLVEPRGDVPLTLRLNWEQRLPTPIARALSGLVWGLERAGFAAGHGVVTYTPSMARQLGLDPDSPRVFPEGARYIRIDRFTPEIPYPERENRVGFLGRLDEEKGVRDLAAAVKRLPADVTFTFIGDGDLRGWLERELAAEVERGEVEFRGWVAHDDVPEELSRLRLLVLPSSPTEGLPTTILESLACGTPVLATPVSGVPDVVREGETGFLMHDRTPPVLAERIESVLAREDLGSVSERGRELIEQKFSFDAAVERYQEILAA